MVNNIYILSSPDKIIKNEYKVGYWNNTKKKLISRYKTYLVLPKILYFKKVSNHKFIENKILSKFDSKRLLFENGKKSEWIKINYEKLKDYAKKIINECGIFENDEVFEKKTTKKDKYDKIIDIYSGNKHIKKFKKCMSKKKFDSITDKKLKNYVSNETKINSCIKSILLYYENGFLSEKILTNFFKTFDFIKKKNKISKLLAMIEWLENELNVNRFKIANLKLNSEVINNVVSKINEPYNKNKFRWLSSQSSYVLQEKEITFKISRLNSEDTIKKFFMDIVNKFDDFYSYENKRVQEKGKRFMIYFNFKFNKEKIAEHYKIISFLNIDVNKFCNFFGKIISNG